ncbi:unnamed protein product [Lactuca virosa]|uniref:Uncharacterized protein n=1 Tax=Lactuca virosa TaxID=75947 RepID=A0AAU9M521_9ASTR|nr:unnamed protein product [Lactuca virosa]
MISTNGYVLTSLVPTSLIPVPVKSFLWFLSRLKAEIGEVEARPRHRLLLSESVKSAIIAVRATFVFRVHSKKRNRLEASKLNNLVYVQFNANLMEKNKKRKDRNMEVLLSNHSLFAQEWIVDCDDCDVDEVDPKTVDEALETNVSQAPRESPKTRELFDEDFESESEEQVLEEDEYESDGVQIMEVCGED